MLLFVTRVDADAVPLLAAGGVLVLLNAAISGPPAGCVHVVSRPVHKWTDVGVVAALVAIPIVFHDRAIDQRVVHDDRLRGGACSSSASPRTTG